MYHGKYKKRASFKKWTEREHNVQDIKDVSHTSVQMSFEITQLPALTFCGLHMKPHGLIRLSEHYNLCIDPELDHGKCEIQQIPCVCVACTNMLDNTWEP